MAASTPSSPRESNDPAIDLVRTVKSYALQETVDPLRGAARWVAVGMIAALSLGLSLVFLTMAVLRLSQDLGGDRLDGSWSFVHYLISLAVVASIVIFTVSRINKPSLEKGA